MKNTKRLILHVKTPKGIKRHDTSKIRRFLHYTKLINWQNKNLRVYLKVTYGKQRDHRNKLVQFYNDGDYETKDDFARAIRAFLERG